MTRPLIVIPARYASTRYPGKPLAALRGAGGRVKPLIRRTWEAARAVAGGPRVVIATDDARIAEAADGFGAEVVMTPEDCANGTERCAAAHVALGGGHGIVVNLQGDAPLTPPAFVEALIASLADSGADAATPVLRCTAAALTALREDRAAGRVGATTAVFARDGGALYFSKEVLPFAGGGARAAVFHHVGIYAFRAATLDAYRGWPAGPLEATEGLEQLRFLENGRRMLCVEVAPPAHGFWELNNPEDIPRIEAALTAIGRE